jgi:hypothetical protein
VLNQNIFSSRISEGCIEFGVVKLASGALQESIQKRADQPLLFSGLKNRY